MAAPNKPKPAYAPAPPEEPVVSQKSEVRIPTPPIGCPVQFFIGGDKSAKPTAAMVLDQQSHPGEVQLRNMRNTIGASLSGVVWAGDPKHDTQGIHSHARKQNGCWDYLPGTVVPECHYGVYEAAQARKAQREAAREPALAK